MSDGLDWQRLGRFVLARRNKLGITQVELQARGGPSASTIQNIELCQITSLKPATKRKLAKGLGWTLESVDALLAGGDATLALPPGTGGRAEVLYEGNGERIIIDIVAGVGELSEADRLEILAFIRMKQARNGP